MPRPSALLEETLVAFSEARRKLASKPNYSTVYRWAKKGRKATNSGQRVFLEYVAIGQRLFTTKEAFARFCDNLSEADA